MNSSIETKNVNGTDYAFKGLGGDAITVMKGTQWGKTELQRERRLLIIILINGGGVAVILISLVMIWIRRMLRLIIAGI